MSFDFYYDSRVGDLRVQDGDILYSRGTDRIQQQIRAALNTELGEWFLDTTKGVPYYSSTGDINDGTQGILGGNYSAAEIAQIMRKVILEVPGVEKINELNISDPDINRNLNVSGNVAVESQPSSGVGTQSIQDVSFTAEVTTS